MVKFRFLPDIATADIAFEAFGKNYSELFRNAGLALEEAMVSTKSVGTENKKEIKLESDSVENLLFSFLEELVYLKDAATMVFSQIKCEVGKRETGGWSLQSELLGEGIDHNKHELRDDVKAITKHMFEVKELSNKAYRCQVVLDV